MKARVVVAGLLGAASLAAFAVAPSARAADTAGNGPDGEVNAQAEAYALRVEYDIPLPAGTGTVAHVNGEARRSNAGENVHGMAAAPSELDAVVGGKYIDPQSTGHVVNRPPQSECFYPGSLLSTSFAFPTDTQSATAPMPATSYSTAQCSAGPTLELHAQDAKPPTNGVIDVDGVAADAFASPVHDLLTSSTEARATGLSILGGVLKIGSVKAVGHSQTTGQPGGAQSSAQVVVSDIAVAGQTFSVSTGTVNGKEMATVTAGTSTVPADSPQGQSVIDSANNSLKPQGCSIAVLTSPSSYPQGYLFSRPDPEIGVKPDGTLAASYRGGLLVVCTMPRSVSDPTTFSPQRMQMLIGFAFTSTSAHGEIGGFDFSDIGSLDTGPVLGGISLDTPSITSVVTSALPGVDVPVATAPATTPALTATVARPPRPLNEQPAVAIPPLRMDQGLRLLLGVVCLVAWGLLTHVGAQRFLAATSDGVGGGDA